MSILDAILPELILIVVACGLFLLGIVNKPAARKASAFVALGTLFVLFVLQFAGIGMGGMDGSVLADPYGSFRVAGFGSFIKLLASGVGILFVLLSWPTNEASTGNSSLDFGAEAGEFFALLLLSISGIFVVAGANDIIVLFLGIELASIPTYIMVSVSRPLPTAQEAGVKYFFLGAMSAGLMLFGFSYLYGTTGTTSLAEIANLMRATLIGQEPGSPVPLSPWQLLALVMVIAGFAFKMAAVPLHFYAGDVYQGAATPVTALLSFVPKASGLVALLKVLFTVGAGAFALPDTIVKLIWIMAALTMTVGNVLGLLQHNVKRVLAYSSVAHSGYLLVGVAAILASRGENTAQLAALRAVLFYLTAYGLMNAAAFGVLMLIPARPLPKWDRHPSTVSAETFDDIAGAGIRHLGLGLAMAVACFSLTGLPLTVGFFGKFYLIQAAWRSGTAWLVVIMMINAAISAAYYLRIVGTMFFKPEPVGGIDIVQPDDRAVDPDEFLRKGAALPIVAAIVISAGGAVLFGTVVPATDMLNSRTAAGTVIDQGTVPGLSPGFSTTPQPADDSDPRRISILDPASVDVTASAALPATPARR